jgi:predicted Rossmann fold nucleotide-binding protein DprA/Smf involved in DNA uptake
VLAELPAHLGLTPRPPAAESDPDGLLGEVLAALTRDEGRHVDHVVAKTGRTPATVAESLLQLELAGWIRALPGARYVRTR